MKKPKKKKTIKILEIHGDDDYNVLVFEKNVAVSDHLRIWNDAMKSTDGVIELTLDESIVRVTAHEFPIVPSEFLEFVREFQDYDISKSHDWFIIEEHDDE